MLFILFFQTILTFTCSSFKGGAEICSKGDFCPSPHTCYKIGSIDGLGAWFSRHDKVNCINKTGCNNVVLLCKDLLPAHRKDYFPCQDICINRCHLNTTCIINCVKAYEKEKNCSYNNCIDEYLKCDIDCLNKLWLCEYSSCQVN
jgi:hypothetical protein